MSTVTGYLSGVSPSLLAFLVFGTTKAFQRKMYRTFIPRFLRKNDDSLTSLRSSHLPISSTNNSSHARASAYYAPQTPKHYPSSSSIRSPPESIVFMPGTPKTPRSVGGLGEPLRHYRSDASIRKPEPIIAEELPPLDLQHLKLKRTYEPATTWLEDESPPESRERERTSQIGIAIGAPTSPATKNNPLVSPWREPTFLRDADDDSIQSEDNRRKSRGWSVGPPPPPPPPQQQQQHQQQQLSIPLSRFNNGSTAGSSTAEQHKRRVSEAKSSSAQQKEHHVDRAGHRRHTSETGSFTQIWSDGRTRPSMPRNEAMASASARLTLGQSARPGRDYSHYVAPVRRGSAA